MTMRWMLGVAAVLVGLAPAACGGGSAQEMAGSSAGGHGGHEASSATSSSSTGGADAGNDGGGAHDGGEEAGLDAATVDGPPMRVACTSTFGDIVTAAFGRLDGYLVSIVPMGTHTCNGDSSHVHLQVEVSGSVYDIAVDIGTAPNDEVGIYQESVTIPDGAWSEGWHSDGALSYKSLSLNSTNFPIQAPATIASAVESALESTSQISIFCTGYTQDNGCHDVHYENGTGNDGAIVLNPLAPTPTILFFRFQSDTFN
jgi:hypothetical protein